MQKLEWSYRMESDLDNQLVGNFKDEIEDIMKNSFNNSVNRDQPEHRGIMEQLVRASNLNNIDNEDFHDWEASFRKIEVELKYLTVWPDELMNQDNYDSNALEVSLNEVLFLEQ